MSAYVKLSTMEYPRYVGDVETDPAGESDYAHVEWLDRPAFNKDTEYCIEAAPVQENGVWHMVWEVRNKTQADIDTESRIIALLKLYQQ